MVDDDLSIDDYLFVPDSDTNTPEIDLATAKSVKIVRLDKLPAGYALLVGAYPYPYILKVEEVDGQKKVKTWLGTGKECFLSSIRAITAGISPEEPATVKVGEITCFPYFRINEGHLEPLYENKGGQWKAKRIDTRWASTVSEIRVQKVSKD